MAARGLGEKYQGMNWIRPEKRLAIYIRDGLACVYCGAAIEDGTRLTLDHIKPWSQDGSNDATNLVTACLRCNSARGDRPVCVFAAAVAEYLDHGIRASAIVEYVNETAARATDVGAARELIARRGGFTRALKGDG